MCKEKVRRKDLEVPKWVREYWASGGTRDEMANILKQQNFNKAWSVIPVHPKHGHVIYAC